MRLVRAGVGVEARENLIDALRLMLSPDDDDKRIVDGQSEPLELTLTA